MKRTKWLPALSMAALCVSLAACGGSNSPTVPTSQPPPVVAPPAPVSTVVAQGSFSGIPVRVLYAPAPFTTTSAGKLDVTVDWTFARTDIDLYLLRGTTAACSVAQFNARQCDFLAFSESVTAKPEKLSVANAAAGTYTIIVANWGPDEESISFQAVLTTGATAAATRAYGQPEKVGARELLTGR